MPWLWWIRTIPAPWTSPSLCSCCWSTEAWPFSVEQTVAVALIPWIGRSVQLRKNRGILRDGDHEALQALSAICRTHVPHSGLAACFATSIFGVCRTNTYWTFSDIDTLDITFKSYRSPGQGQAAFLQSVTLILDNYGVYIYINWYLIYIYLHACMHHGLSRFLPVRFALNSLRPLLLWRYLR